jgi:hypothetical protein
MLRDWTLQSRRKSDEVLLAVNDAVEKGDHLSKVKSVVEAAQKAFGYDIDYSSGLVLERNSILNLAVIKGRTKVAKW